MNPSDIAFSGSVPQIYERFMVPLFFTPYATDLSARVLERRPTRVLEVAAGTGVVTRALATTLPPQVPITATDLNQEMLDQASALGTSRSVEWTRADAMQLPYADETFDVVVCQFGVMFFPDKVKAFHEARRVLAPGGALLFSVWDRLEHNEFAETVSAALETLFSGGPPPFMARVPHGYFDTAQIARDLAAGGFARAPEFDTVTLRSCADSPGIPAIALCQGTPMRGEITARDPARLEEATACATAAIADRFGSGAVEGKMQAHVILVKK